MERDYLKIKKKKRKKKKKKKKTTTKKKKKKTHTKFSVDLRSIKSPLTVAEPRP